MAGTIIGCDSSPCALAPVAGTLTIEGKPYTGGKVVLYPIAAEGSIEAGRPAFGIPDANGRFTLSTYQPDDGAIVGRHTMTVFAAANHEEIRPDLASIEFTRVTVPTGPVEVKVGENTLDVALTAEELRRYGNRL